MKQKPTNIYRLEDLLAEAYGPTFEAPTHAVANRYVKQMKMDTPQDWILHWVAAIQETGQIYLIGINTPDDVDEYFNTGNEPIEWNCEDIYKNNETIAILAPNPQLNRTPQ